MKRRVWVAFILLAAVAINAVIFAVVRSRKAPAVAEAVPGPTPIAVASPAPPPVKPANAETESAEDVRADLARARRAAGMAALKDGDYEIAVSNFTEALSLTKENKGDLEELRRLADDMRVREIDRRRTTEVAKASPAPAPAPTRSSSSSRVKSAPVRLSARPAPEEKPAPPAEPRNGLLLVTSTPPGLVVLVDGKATDLTPARVMVRPGNHRVGLAQGERKLFEESVDVGEDAVRAVNQDLTAKLAPPPAAVAAVAPPPVAPPIQPAAVAATGGSVANPPPAVAARRPEPSPAISGLSPSPPPAPVTPVTAAVSGKGSLDVTSPGLYGEVWINDRPYGFPPVVARDLAAGKARVEIRVHGAVKRKMTVEVEPEKQTSVRIR